MMVELPDGWVAVATIAILVLIVILTFSNAERK